MSPTASADANRHSPLIYEVIDQRFYADVFLVMACRSLVLFPARCHELINAPRDDAKTRVKKMIDAAMRRRRSAHVRNIRQLKASNSTMSPYAGTIRAVDEAWRSRCDNGGRRRVNDRSHQLFGAP